MPDPKRHSGPAGPRPLRAGALACVGALSALSPAWAQELVAARDGILRPSATAEGTYFETRSRPAGDNGRELVTRLSPGLRWTSRSGRLQGEADYVATLQSRRGRSSTQGEDYQNALSARLLADLIPSRAGLEARAAVTQQAISAFGEQSPSGSLLAESNRTEVATASVAPFVRGNLSDQATYELRGGVNFTHTRGGETPDSRGSDVQLTLGSPRGRLLGWSVVASERRVESDSRSGIGQTAENIRLRLAGTVMASPQLQFSANGGVENIDEGYQAPRRTERTAGLGLQWTPSLRTQLAASAEKRHFGTGGRLNFSHRGQQTALNYAFVRDTNFSVDGAAGGAPLTLFQLAFNQAASQIPDPVAREQAVLADLISRGLDPNQVVAVVALGPAFSLQQRQDLSFAWFGRRVSLTLSAFTLATNTFVSRPGDTPVSSDPVKQRGWSSTLSYRLSPYTALSLGGERRLTEAGLSGAANDLKSADLSLTSQIGRRTTARCGVRYSVFNSTTDPYRATSVSASLTQRF